MRSLRFLSVIPPVLWAIAVPAVAQPSQWIVARPASQIGFRSSMGGAAFAGSFRRWDARIAFDPAALDRSSVVTVIDLGSATTGDASRDQSLPTADWFNVARFPRATFAASKFKSLGGGRYVASGTLTIKGVTRPVVLPFNLTTAGTKARMQGSLTLDRRAFGIGQGQFAGADTIPFNVQVVIRVDATRRN